MPKTQHELLARLDRLGVAHTTIEHEPVWRMADGAAIQAALPGAFAKNLFLKDAKGQLWLISTAPDTRVDLKRLQPVIGAARLSFGSAERLWEALGVRPGAVSVLALVNDDERTVRLVLDEALLEATAVNFHPLVHTATTSLSVAGLRRFLEALGVEPQVVDFAALAAPAAP